MLINKNIIYTILINEIDKYSSNKLKRAGAWIIMAKAININVIPKPKFL